MNIIPGLGARVRGLFSDNKGPWGSSSGGSGGGNDGGDGTPTPGPWGDQPRRRKPSRVTPDSNVSSLDDFLRKSRARFGGGGGPTGGGSFPFRPDASLIGWGLAGLVLLWLLFTTMHRIAPEERGVVTRFGRYNTTLSPGIGLTLPSPIDRVRKIDVENIRTLDLGSSETETLMLTGDQNIIDIAYSVRWNIRDPESFMFEIADPEDAIRSSPPSSASCC
jgi:membrane protease subunit HflK